MSGELEHIWSRVQAELALAVDESTYRIWLAPLHALELSGETLLVEAPPHTSEWVCGRFGRILQASVELILGPHAELQIVAAQTPGAPPPGSARPASATRAPAPPTRAE